MDALTYSLESSDNPSKSDGVFAFLDSCSARYNRKTAHYQAELEMMASTAGSNGHQSTEARAILSPFLLTLVEQWPFIVKSTAISGQDKEDIASWLNKFFACLDQIGEDERLLSQLIQVLRQNAATDRQRALLEHASAELRPSKELPLGHTPTLRRYKTRPASDPPHLDTADQDETIENVTYPAEDASVIFRWMKKDVQEVIEDGDTAGLIMCLCSQEIGVRRQAATAMTKLIARLQGSAYAEKEMTLLLLQETLHNAVPLIDHGPMPTFLAVFASRAISVEATPQHCLYGKISHFLHRGPTWDAAKLPLINRVLLYPPDADDGHYEEVEWVLDSLLEGLRTTAVSVSETGQTKAG